MTLQEKKLGELTTLIQALAPGWDGADVQRWARGLMITAVLNKAAEHNLGHLKGTARAQSEVSALNKSAIALLEKIDALGTEARNAVEKELQLQLSGFDTWRTMESLTALANAAYAAHALIGEWPPTRPAPRRARKDASKAVCRDAGRIYEHMTGRRASVIASDGVDGGPFVSFFGKVLTILEIDASPAATVRALMENKRKK